MKDEKKKNSYNSSVEYFQTVISISYLLAVGIGMLFIYQKYSRFGINIFDYADVLDFLIAPFADFMILIFCIISIVISYLLYKFDLYWERKYPRIYSKMMLGLTNKPWYNTYRYGCYLLLFATYLYLSASLYGKLAMKRIKQQPEIEILFADNQVEKGILIGKTKDIIFLLKNQNVKAIPITSLVKEFDIRK